ncbi:MAG TPA: DUF4129 domain-containing protein [Amnibacterium sp.]|nr:DUF4129 domain-containing protein [Amnibacterium sp.]
MPVQPGGDQARQWLEQELAKAPYQAAKPTPFDIVAQAVLQWFQSLFTSKTSVAPPVLLVAALVVVVALLVVALVLFGVPRLNRRSRMATGLFGDDDRRTADELRRSAAAASAAGDWSTAVLERFRGLARGLDERTVLTVFPGTTATGFARRAAQAFPDRQRELDAAAAVFDDVRYAGRAAKRAEAEAVAALDDRLAAAHPLLEDAAAPPR